MMQGAVAQRLDLRHGAYSAAFGRQGAALHSLRHDGRDLVLRTDDAVATPPYAGAVLAPWPNRIANGRYRFEGERYQLPVNEVGRGNALHGLALWQEWTVVDLAASSATLEVVLWPQPGYPFTVRVGCTYELSDAGLAVTISARNEGDRRAPIGLSWHPYLQVGDGGALDGWRLHLPCDQVILTDDRLLPHRTAAVEHTAFDFRAPRPLGDARIDHAFTGAMPAEPAALLLDAAGTGVRVGWEPSSRWLQVYTLEAPGTSLHRRAVAIEPMTCAPDAFNSGAGLTALEPGATTSTTIRITAVTV